MSSWVTCPTFTFTTVRQANCLVRREYGIRLSFFCFITLEKPLQVLSSAPHIEEYKAKFGLGSGKYR